MCEHSKSWPVSTPILCSEGTVSHDRHKLRQAFQYYNRTPVQEVHSDEFQRAWCHLPPNSPVPPWSGDSAQPPIRWYRSILAGATAAAAASPEHRPKVAYCRVPRRRQHSSGARVVSASAGPPASTIDAGPAPGSTNAIAGSSYSAPSGGAIHGAGRVLQAMMEVSCQSLTFPPRNAAAAAAAAQLLLLLLRRRRRRR